jgi:hypothetical protein
MTDTKGKKHFGNLSVFKKKRQKREEKVKEGRGKK